VEVTWCLECGQIQGKFPLKTPKKFVKIELEKIDIDELFS